MKSGGGGGGGGKGGGEASSVPCTTSSTGDSDVPLERRRGNDGRPPLSAAAAASEISPNVNLDVVQQSALSGSKTESSSSSVAATPAATATAAPVAATPAADPQANAFGQLVKAWEKYMDDTPQVDPFETLKKLQNLHLFGPKTPEGTADAASATSLQAQPQLNPNECVYGYYPAASSFAAAMMPGMPMYMNMGQLQHPHPLAPPALRHTHSSPLQRATSVLDNHFLDSSSSGLFGSGFGADGNDNGVMPPPIPLDPFQRSSSTPSAFRTRSVNSAFGTVPHTHVGSGLTQSSIHDYSIRTGGEASYYAHDPSVHIRASAFDPVKYYARALEVQEDMERTSIEVMDMTTTTTTTASITATSSKVKSAKKTPAPPAAAVSASAAPKESTGAASATDELSEAFTTADDDTMATKSIFKRGAGSRAERFLSNVRVLRRRRRTTRGGRENPAQPASVSSSSNASSRQNESTSSCASTSTAAQGKSPFGEHSNSVAGAGAATSDVSAPVLVATAAAASPSPSTESSSPHNMDTCTTVTVVTEPDYNPNDTSMLSQSSELSAIVKGAAAKQDASRQRSQDSKDSSSLDVMTKSASANTSTYQQLDSDADEDEVRYQNIGVTTESPVPSPCYQMIDDRRSAKELLSKKQAPLISPLGVNKDVTAPVASPSPTRMTCGHDQDPNTPPQGTPPSSHDSVTASPQTARSSNTGSSSSGHTTQAASTSSGHPSVLSTISETDREVMEANKEAKRRRGLQGLRNLPQLQKHTEPADESVHSSSTNSNSTNPHRYLALQNSTSPVPLREGANDPVERFFIDDAAAANSGTNSSSGTGASSSNHLHPTTTQRSQSTRSQSTTTSGSRPSGRTGSPATLGSFSASSSSGTQEEPPTFVSYMDRQGASDLTSLREETEASSKRAGLANNEEREGSPAELDVGYQEVVFQEAQPKAVRPDRIRGRLDKFRTRPARPPRSPVKGCRPSTTPPPRGHSPICHTALSPPRDIVDHPHSNISKPFVMRMGQSSLVGAATTTTTTTASAVEDMIGLTYAESSIEVLQADSSKEEMPMSNLNIVTPEKEVSSASSA